MEYPTTDLDPKIKKALFKTFACGTGRWLNEATPDMTQDQRNDLINTWRDSKAYESWYRFDQNQRATSWYYIVASGNQSHYVPGTLFYDPLVVNATFTQP